MFKFILSCVLTCVCIVSIFGKDFKLIDFESASKVNKISKRNAAIYKGAINISPNKLWSTSGKSSLNMSFEPFKKGIYQWPGLICNFKNKDYLLKDWSKYGKLALDIQNPTAYTIRLCVEIRSTAGKNGNTTVFSIAPNSERTLKIELEKISEKTSRPVDLKNVQQIILYCARPPEPWQLNIDNIRLLDNRKQLKCLGSYKHARMLTNYIFAENVREKYRKELEKIKTQIFAQDSNLSAKELADKSGRIANEIRKGFYKPAYAWSFGPLQSGKAADWINAGRNKYSPEKKFGWKNTGNLKCEKKSFGSAWRKPGNYFVTSRPPELYLNPEQEGLVSSYKRGDFVIDLPNGSYRVLIMAGYPGGLRMCPVDMTVGINGVNHRLTLPNRYIYKTPVWKTTVKNGRLNISFASNTKAQWLVNAIAVWPEKDQEIAKAEFLRRLHDHITILPEQLRSEWIDARCEPKSRKNLVVSKYPAGFALFPTNTLFDYTYDYTPEKYNLNGLKLTAVRNETATAMFGVLALPTAGEKLKVTVSALEGPVKIPAENLKVNMVVNVPWPEHKGFGPRYKIGKIIRVPRRLENLYEDSFDWDKWQARQLYVMIKPPKNGFEAGSYRGTIKLQSGKGKAVSLAVELKVLPVTLKANPKMSYGAYWYLYKEKRETRVRSEMKEMREHGFNMLGPVRFSVRPKLGNGKVTFQMPAEPSRTLLLGREYGFTRPAPFQIEGVIHALCKVLYGKTMFKKQGVGAENLPDSFYPHLTTLVSEVRVWLKKHNLTEVYFYPVDEVHNIDFARKLLTACRKVPGAKIFCNYNPLIQQELKSLIDVSCYPYTMYMNENGLRKLIRKTPRRLTWTYSCPGSYGGDKVATRLCWGLSGRKIGLNGFWPWAFCSPQGNPYSAFDGSWIDPMLVYPGLKLISTTQYESIRQGIDDARYLYTLKCLISEAKKSKDSARIKAAEQTQKELTGIMKKVPCLFRTRKAASWAQKELEATRNQMVKLILALQK